MRPEIATVVGLPFVTGLVLALALVPVSRVIAMRVGMVAHPRHDRWHRESIPLLGGLGIVLATLVAAIVSGIAADVPVLLATVTVIFMVGLVDDILAVKPFTKLISQIAMAAILVYFDSRLGWLDSRLADSMLTMVWVVGLTNAFNLLDNMDGLCGGTALVVAITLVIGLLTGASRDVAGPQVAYLAALAGAVTGFLVFNFPPASVFMGDSGSLFLGFSLAALTLTNDGVRASRSDVLSAIAGPVFVLLVPIFDTTLVTVMRLLSGRSPAQGGRDHSSHRLVSIGLSERGAVYVLWSLAAMGGTIGLVVRSATQGFSLLVGGLFAIFMSLFALYLAHVRVYAESAAAPVDEAGVTPIETELLYKKRVFEVLVDFGLISVAYYVANRLWFDAEAYLANAETFYSSLPLLVAVQLVTFFVVGVYRDIWRKWTPHGSVAVAAGVALVLAGTEAILFVWYPSSSDLKMVFLLYAAIVVSLATLSRVAMRVLGGVFG